MDSLKWYLFTSLNLLLIIILLLKWIKYSNSKSSKNGFFNSFFYSNYQIINSRNSISKRNKKIQNGLSLLLLFLLSVEFFFILIFDSLSNTV